MLAGVDKVMQEVWALGTGYHQKGDTRAYKEVNDRIHLIAYSWGYSRKLDVQKRKTPEISMTCISTLSKSTTSTENSAGLENGSKDKKRYFSCKKKYLVCTDVY
jgi:hypothetical protein